MKKNERSRQAGEHETSAEHDEWHYLSNARYPASRDQLRNAAERNGATDEFLQMIDGLPDKQRFNSVNDVQQAIETNYQNMSSSEQ